MTETRIIKYGDQDWKVTPFHFVVEAISSLVWSDLQVAWMGAFWGIGGTVSENTAALEFIYPPQWKDFVQRRRDRFSSSPPFKWILSFTNNPLVVNELKPEEVTLACVENPGPPHTLPPRNKITLTNFADLPGIQDALKVYKLGEFWVSYATGGQEIPLRTGGKRQ